MANIDNDGFPTPTSPEELTKTQQRFADEQALSIIDLLLQLEKPGAE